MRAAVHLSVFALAIAAAATACRGEGGEAPMRAEAAAVEARLAKYAPTVMETDLRGYSEREKALLRELLAAAQLADEIFWRQTSHVAAPLRERVRTKYREDSPVRRFFFMQAGPYDRLDHETPFMPDVSPRPPGGAFYPEDLTADEFNAWLAAHPEDREALLSPYTVIRRDGAGLVAVPYHEAYADLLKPMVETLRRAADLADNESFARYLRAKAAALETDQYFDADTAWIHMAGSKFDLTIGPFEVYEDALLGLKASYGASVEVVDAEESAKLEAYKRFLPELEANLPYDDRYKPQGAALTAAFAIVRDIYRGGDLRVGYQAVASNLPNDPRVASEVGTKKTFWKNIFEGRVNQVILPISRALIAESQAGDVTAQGYFDVVLLHEMAHGLGPRYAETPGGRVPVNQALTSHYSWLEEAKATMAGLASLAYLSGAGVIDPALDRQHYASYLGSIFRTVRFGTGEAHGLAALVELNYHLEKGGVRYDAATGRYAVDHAALPASVQQLARELLTIEATGDAAAAQVLRDRYGQRTPELEAALARVAAVPVDLAPEYRNTW
jgi:hypothetical protein